MNTSEETAKQVCTILFPGHPPLETEHIVRGLRLVDPGATVEWDRRAATKKQLIAGKVILGPHRIFLLAVNSPLNNATMIEQTIGVSSLPPEEKEELSEHQGYIRCLYLQGSDEPLAQLTALYHVARAILPLGALGILNERAWTVQPANMLGHLLENLTGVTPPIPLWIGFVPYVGERGFWFRTYGLGSQFKLPDLAFHAADQGVAEEIYHVFMNIALYLIRHGNVITPGHTVEIGSTTYYFADPDTDLDILASETGMLVLIEI